MSQFLHVAFHWAEQPKVKALEPVFNMALDWLRYAPNCWIVWTNKDPKTWIERLKPLMGPNDHVFICELNMRNRQGWLPQWIWKWINKTRN